MSTAKPLSQDQAFALMVGDADSLPYRVLNEKGERALDAFVAEYAKRPDLHRMAAWYAQAANSEANHAADENVIVEMRGFQTANGNPATVSLGAECFDWYINS